MKIKDYEYYFLIWLGDELSAYFQSKRKLRHARTWWHRWWAWRPVRIPEANHDAIKVPAHYVLWEYVDVQKIGLFWYRYRPNTLEKDIYQITEKRINNGAWEEVTITKPLKELVIIDHYRGR